jgi:hypothetical protein
MRKFIVLSVLALAVPVAALASSPTPGTPTQQAAAKAACKTARTTLGVATFNLTYVGTTNANRANAFGKCVSAAVKKDQANTTAAVKTCKAAQLADKTAFKANYASLGKCVSATTTAANHADQAATISAAKSCKAALVAAGTTAAFNKTYGSFGKCVSTKIHTP